jgi:Cohesin domain
MPKKTLALITGLVIVTIVLFIIALHAGQEHQPAMQQQTAMVQPTPMVPAHTVLMVNPDTLAIVPGTTGKVDVVMNTFENNVTAVQLELGYDPHIISNVKVTTGSMFTNPVVLIDKNNPVTGRYTYAFGITPNSNVVRGEGVVAIITFTALYGANGKEMQLGILPSSLVTARGVAQSVLKSESGTVIHVGQTTTPVMMHTTTQKMSPTPKAL